MNAATAAELLRLPRRHPAECRALVSVAGWAVARRRDGDTGPIRYSRSCAGRGVVLEDAVREILAEAQRVAESSSLSGSSTQRRREAEGEVEQHQGEADGGHRPTVAPSSPIHELGAR